MSHIVTVQLTPTEAAEMLKGLRRLKVLANITTSRLARESSRFLYAIDGDALSRTVSWIREIWTKHHEAADIDAGFDGGEFSRPAHDRLAHDEVRFLKQHYFNYTGVPFEREVIARVGIDVAMKLDVLTLGDDED